jgi:hypothetical protein
MNFPAECCGLFLLLLCETGCRQEMYNQPKYKEYTTSAFFTDGSSARPPVPGTFPYRASSKEPEPVLTAALLWQGKETYEISCSPCHDSLGNGKGQIVRRGFPPPPSFHTSRLREQPAEYFSRIAADGFRSSPSYRRILSASQLFALGEYIKTLQLSQNFPVENLSAEERTMLDRSSAGQEAGDGRQNAESGK